MKVGFDARMIGHSGIGTYIRGLLDRLTSMDHLDMTLYGDPLKLADYSAKKVSCKFPIYGIQEQLWMPRLIGKDGADLVHIPHYNVPLGVSRNVVVTMHDLIHLKFPPSKMAYLYARGMLGAAAKKAKKIIAVSNHTKKDLMEILKVPENKIHVVYHGITSPGGKGPGLSAELDKKVGKDPYILYVGNVRPAKNISFLIEAFNIASAKVKDMRLLFAGRNFMPDFTKQFENHPRIKYLGEISHTSLGIVYKGARLFVFPSLYEGFGFPPLEAMSYGVPVICSNAASLPETAGEAASYFDPGNAEELAGLMVQFWKDESLRKSLSEKGLERVKQFSWEKCARETIGVYENAF